MKSVGGEGSLISRQVFLLLFSR